MRWPEIFSRVRARASAHPWVLAAAMVAVALLAVAYFAFARPELGMRVSRALLPTAAPAPAPKLPTLVATYRDRPPDLVSYSPGWHSGPLRYVLEEAASRIGYAVVWKEVPFSGSLTDLMDGSADVVPYVFHKTPEREKAFRFSVSLGQQSRPVYFALHKGDRSVIKTLGDLAGHTIGYRKGSYYFAGLHSPSAPFKRVAYDDDREMMQGFINGDVDVIVLNDKEAGERTLASLGYSEYQYADLVLEEQPEMFFLYSRKPQLQGVFDRLDQALVQMKAEGSIADIYRSFDAVPPQMNSPAAGVEPVAHGLVETLNE